MGVAATPKCKEGAYWTHRVTTELWDADQKGFDHHAFHVGYNATNIFYSTIKVAKGVWGLADSIYVL